MINRINSCFSKKIICKIKCVLLLALIATQLSGCFEVFVFAGRGDWSIPISEHYKIVRSNGSEISLNYYEEKTSTISKRVIKNFYIVKFYTNEQTIYLSGIPTVDEYATEEERESTDYYYCIVDMPTKTVTGPMSDTDWRELCVKMDLDLSDKWIPATYETAETYNKTA